MHVRVRLDGANPRRWHVALLNRLSGLPGITTVSADTAPGPEAWPPQADLLFRLEALIFRLAPNGSRPVPPADLAAWTRPAAPDLVLDLCGDAVAPCPVWRVAYDGGPGEAGLLASLLAGSVPHLDIREGGTVVASGRLGSDYRGSIALSFEDALTRTTLVARSLVGRLYRLCYHAPHWRTGWRTLRGPDLIALGGHPAGGWQVLPDDGRRFYADPFPLAVEGTTHVFVEEFPHATGKAIISAVRFGPDGPEGPPVPVLEEPHHLSYPFVFARAGSVWMVPESSAAGTVDLYRATRYPGGWVKEATLLSGVVASDATLLEHGGRWWMFATVRDAPVGAPPGSGCHHDALYLWSAPDFRGPYTPHPANPVLVDPSFARPAGRIVARDEGLIRPVQDCAHGYGRALSLARIDRLDPEGFAQTILNRIEPGPAWPGSCLHTLNTGGGIECIDGSGRASRLRARRAAPT
ncbi:formyl transferase [Methylobacterium oryzae]|uniref:glucosamine inositolphosphorylceramide transferase family protein n=1 Tax=Methylobacterium oryzae TaxID=334852 RepID=UPI002F2FCCCD